MAAKRPVSFLGPLNHRPRCAKPRQEASRPIICIGESAGLFSSQCLRTILIRKLRSREARHLAFLTFSLPLARSRL